MKHFLAWFVAMMSTFAVADIGVQPPTDQELDRFLPPDFGINSDEDYDEDFDDEYRIETDPSSGHPTKAIYIGTGIGRCDPQRVQKIRCNNCKGRCRSSKCKEGCDEAFCNGVDFNNKDHTEALKRNQCAPSG